MFTEWSVGKIKSVSDNSYHRHPNQFHGCLLFRMKRRQPKAGRPRCWFHMFSIGKKSVKGHNCACMTLKIFWLSTRTGRERWASSFNQNHQHNLKSQVVLSTCLSRATGAMTTRWNYVILRKARVMKDKFQCEGCLTPLMHFFFPITPDIYQH